MKDDLRERATLNWRNDHMRDATRARRQRFVAVFFFTLVVTFVSGMLAVHVATQFGGTILRGFSAQ